MPLPLKLFEVSDVVLADSKAVVAPSTGTKRPALRSRYKHSSRPSVFRTFPGFPRLLVVNSSAGTCATRSGPVAAAIYTGPKQNTLQTSGFVKKKVNI
ncbi:conserved hypothetical protein [Culex quinquefasciatus]|uniref:Uncharacterized protein n=1 Tax=Culex quinquefasciatus TaxID=7176 RepID=B0X603_CULQU|nr:conserved hypothetical protein [Culex quinquefasciatus]|eukprot:XP_001865075.1 conserved hypothetical protein [Culex quinquefasciatus]